MSEFNQAVLITSIIRVAGLLCGGLFAFLGYRLFVKGYFEKAGELNAIWGKQRLVLKQVAPGVFFALLGVLVVFISAQHPMEVSERKSDNKAFVQPGSSVSFARLLAINPSLQFCKPELGSSAQKLLNGMKLTPDEHRQLAACVIEAMTANSQPSYIEKITSDELRLARPGEIIIGIPNGQLSGESLKDSAPKK